MWCVLTVELKKQYEAATAEVTSLPAGIKGITIAKGTEGWEAARAHWDASSATIKTLAEMGPEQLEKTIFRLKPIFPEPREKLPWVWNMTLTVATPTEVYIQCAQLARFGPKPSLLYFSSASQKDGPLCKWLGEWTGKQG